MKVVSKSTRRKRRPRATLKLPWGTIKLSRSRRTVRLEVCAVIGDDGVRVGSRRAYVHLDEAALDELQRHLVAMRNPEAT